MGSDGDRTAVAGTVATSTVLVAFVMTALGCGARTALASSPGPSQRTCSFTDNHGNHRAGSGSGTPGSTP